MTAPIAADLARLDERVTAQSARLEIAHERVDRHGDRLTSLEKWRYALMGAVAFAGFQSSIALALLAAWLKTQAR